MSTITGSIGGTSIEGHVRAMHSRAHLCTPGQTVSLTIDPSFPYDPSPSDEIVLYVESIGFLPNYPTEEQCGFVYSTPTSIGYTAVDVNTGIYTVAPVGDSFSYYYQGVKYTSGALTLQMSFPLTGPTEIYYISIVDEMLVGNTTPWPETIYNNTVVKVATVVKTPGYNPGPRDVVGRQVIWAESDVTTKIFTGNVQKVTRNKPSFDLVVEGMDTYQRCQSYFIDEQINTGYTSEVPDANYVPLTTSYWIGYLMGLCGAGYTISGVAKPVPQGVQLGLRTVHESLQDILAYSSQYVFPNAEGVVEIKYASRISAQHTFRRFIEFEHKRDDEWTRNVIKVRGGVPAWGNNAVAPFAVASVGLDGIVPDRIAYIATPMIETQAECQRVADYMLSELGEVTRIATGTIIGNPNVHIGQAARLVYLDFDKIDTVTSLESDFDENGYVTKVTIGERCPRISGWQHVVPPIYAGTSDTGVYKSADLGATWAAYNGGLSGLLNAKRIAFNSYDEGMAIINGKLYYNPGGDTAAWSLRYLPAPINSANDSPAPGYGSIIAVDALGTEGAFSALTTTTVKTTLTSGSFENEFRSWVYTCTSTGSAPSSWVSTQLVNTTSSGSAGIYDIYGIDMTSPNGSPYVLATTGGGGGGFGNGRLMVELDTSSPRIRLYEDWNNNYKLTCKPCEANLGITDFRVEDILFTDSTRRYVSIWFAVDSSASGTSSLFIYGSTGSMGAYQRCGVTQEINGDSWNRWELQTFGHYRTPTQWRVQHTVDCGTLFQTGSGSMPTQYLNFFVSPHVGATLGRNNQMIYGTDCLAYVAGISPYGDTGGQLFHTTAPYPVWSALNAVKIYIG